MLRLEIELIQLGRLEETDKLEYNLFKDLIVKYEPALELMDQQSQIQSNNPPPQNPSSTHTIFSFFKSCKGTTSSIFTTKTYENNLICNKSTVSCLTFLVDKLQK